MIIATIIYVICVFALMLHYQRKIKKLKKENRRIIETHKRLDDFNKTLILDRTIKYKLYQMTISEYFDGNNFGSIENRIEIFSREIALKSWRIYKDFLEREIYAALFDKLVTDDRTVEDNKKMMKVELNVPYIQISAKDIAVRIFE